MVSTKELFTAQQRREYAQFLRSRGKADTARIVEGGGEIPQGSQAEESFKTAFGGTPSQIASGQTQIQLEERGRIARGIAGRRVAEKEFGIVREQPVGRNLEENVAQQSLTPEGERKVQQFIRQKETQAGTSLTPNELRNLYTQQESVRVVRQPTGRSPTDILMSPQDIRETSQPTIEERVSQQSLTPQGRQQVQQFIQKSEQKAGQTLSEDQLRKNYQTEQKFRIGRDITKARREEEYKSRFSFTEEEEREAANILEEIGRVSTGAGSLEFQQGENIGISIGKGVARGGLGLIAGSVGGLRTGLFVGKVALKDPERALTFFDPVTTSSGRRQILNSLTSGYKESFKLDPFGTAAEVLTGFLIPTKGGGLKIKTATLSTTQGDRVFTSLVFLGDRPILTKSPEGLGFGKPSPKKILPKGVFVKEGEEIFESRLAFRLFGTEKALERITPESLSPKVEATKVSDVEFLVRKFSGEKVKQIEDAFSEGTKNLSQKGVSAVVEELAKNKDAITFGSFSTKQQVKGFRKPADIDIQLKSSSPEEAVNFAKLLEEKLRSKGEPVTIDPDKPTTLINTKTKSKAIEIKYKGQEVLEPESPVAKSAIFGLEFEKSPLTIKGAKFTQLGEELSRKGAGVVRVSKKGLRPPPFREKDVPDFLKIAETSIGLAEKSRTSLFKTFRISEGKIRLERLRESFGDLLEEPKKDQRITLTPRELEQVSPSRSPLLKGFVESPISPIGSPLVKNIPSPRPSPSPSPRVSPQKTSSPIKIESPSGISQLMSPRITLSPSPIVTPPSPRITLSPSPIVTPPSPRITLSPSPLTPPSSPSPILSPPQLNPPTSPPFKTQRKQRERGEEEQGYDVYVKRKQLKKGKGSYISRGFTKVNSKPLAKESAFERGASIVDEYTNKSFFLKKSGKASLDFTMSSSFLKNKFRTSKKQKNVYVEKDTFAIDSRTEKEGIPYESARQRKRQKALGLISGKTRNKRSLRGLGRLRL